MLLHSFVFFSASSSTEFDGKLINFLLFGFHFPTRVKYSRERKSKPTKVKAPKNLSNFSSANHFVTNKSQTFISLL